MDIIIKPGAEFCDVDNIADYINKYYNGDYDKGIEHYKDDVLMYYDNKLQIVIEARFDTDVRCDIDKSAREYLDHYIASYESEIKEQLEEVVEVPGTERLRLQDIAVEYLENEDDKESVWCHHEPIDLERFKPIEQIIAEQTGDCWAWQTVLLKYESDYDEVTLMYNSGGTLMTVCDCDGHDTEWKDAKRQLTSDELLKDIIYLDDNYNFEN